MNFNLIDSAGSAIGPRLSAIVRTTRSFTIPAWGRKAYVVLHGAGGSGAWASSTSITSVTGGNSAPWGVVTIDVAHTKILTVNIGAGGAPPAPANTNGNAGGASTLVYDGSTIMTVNGGEGGIYAASGLVNPATVSATVTGADFWVPGLPAWQANNSASGGAAANIFNILSAELSMTSAISGRSVGSVSDTPSRTPLMGLMHTAMPVMFFSTTVGHPGVGGDGATHAGLFAGGGATGGGGTAMRGGQGGGGGGGVRNPTVYSNNGGDALGYVVISE